DCRRFRIRQRYVPQPAPDWRVRGGGPPRHRREGGGGGVRGGGLPRGPLCAGGPLLVAPTHGRGPGGRVRRARGAGCRGGAASGIVGTALPQPSRNLTITDLDAAAMYIALYVVGDPNSANTISHVSLLGHTRARNGEYGVALHNGGDDCLVENLYTYRVDRPFFFYGVQNVNNSCVGDQTAFCFAPVLKSYSRSTRKNTIRYSAINQPGQSGAVAKINFQVQHDPAVIDPPPTVQAVTLDYDESNMTSGGNGVQFDYYAGPGGLTPQSSSSHQLFNDFVLRGATNNTVLTTVAVNGAAASPRINLEKFQFKRPKSANDLDNNGFQARQRWDRYAVGVLRHSAARRCGDRPLRHDHDVRGCPAVRKFRQSATLEGPDELTRPGGQTQSNAGREASVRSAEVHDAE